MNQTVAIVILVVIAVITASIIVGAYWFFSTVKTIQEENTFCQNWYNNLEERRAEAEDSFWKELAFDYDQYNAEVADYNKECYY